MNFTYERLESVQAVQEKIKECEGNHVQQVAFSSFMDALTQVCFTERMVRSVIEWSAIGWPPRSWVPKPEVTPKPGATHVAMEDAAWEDHKIDGVQMS